MGVCDDDITLQKLQRTRVASGGLSLAEQSGMEENEGRIVLKRTDDEAKLTSGVLEVWGEQQQSRAKPKGSWARRREEHGTEVSGV